MTTLYTEDHEWLQIDGDVVTGGITDYAQAQLGDVVFVELPKVGRTLTKAEAAAVVESVKAASDVYAPISGEVVEINQSVVDEPALVNTDAAGKAWFFKMKIADKSELGGLMDEAAYKAHTAGCAAHGHPVITGAGGRLERPRRTGSSAFADDDTEFE